MSDNVRLWMGAFESMSVTECGYGIYIYICLLYQNSPCRSNISEVKLVFFLYSCMTIVMCIFVLLGICHKVDSDLT